MPEKNRKLFIILYFAIGLLISFYVCSYRLAFWSFFLSSIFTFLCFIGIYFCFSGISKSKSWLKIFRGIGILIFLAIIGIMWKYSSYSGFNSSYGYNLVGKNIFTGSTEVYGNYPPWYVKTIGGEEARKILLNNCINRKSLFYDQNPNYCDIYKIENSNNNWSIGPNP